LNYFVIKKIFSEFKIIGMNFVIKSITFKRRAIMKNFYFILLVLCTSYITSAQTFAPVDFKVVDLKPEFPGGHDEFIRFIGKNYVFPEVDNMSGIVKINFVIEKDGNVSEIKVLSDLGSGTGEEAVRVMKKCPKWTPGIQDGQVVRVIYTLPITIELHQ
jgi:Gram-negative bacterial TonB protein C-terminal